LNWNFIVKEIRDNDLLIDCRSLSAYEEETLDEALYYPFIKKAFGSDTESYKKLSSPIYSILDEATLRSSGRIVVFDEGMGMYASRMVYLLRGAGFRETYILGAKWPVEGNKSPGINKKEPPIMDKLKTIDGVVDKAFMEKNLTRLQVFDTRTREEYEGKLPRMQSPEEGTLCGRLPGSFLWDWRSLYDTAGNIIDKSTFRKRMNAFPFMPERPTVLYDYNGVRSCLLALMLKEFGYQEVFTYQGSWFEYRKSNLPKQATSMYGVKVTSPAAPRLGGMDRKK
jgi:thiosulfate/3-mercaptopyruvate sulfurtransferase